MQFLDGQEHAAKLITEEAEETGDPVQEHRKVMMTADIGRVAGLQRRAVIAQGENALTPLQQGSRQPQHRRQVRSFRGQRDALHQSGPRQQPGRPYLAKRPAFGSVIQVGRGLVAIRPVKARVTGSSSNRRSAPNQNGP